MQIFIFQRRLDTKKRGCLIIMSVTSTGVLEFLPFKLSLETPPCPPPPYDFKSSLGTPPCPPPPPPPETLLAGYWEEDNFNFLNSIIANIHLLFFIQVVNCGDPGTPPNGVRYGDVFTYLSHVILECDPRYRLVGNLLRTCQADGTWSGSQPTCQGKNTKGAQRSCVTVHSQWNKK